MKPSCWGSQQPDHSHISDFRRSQLDAHEVAHYAKGKRGDELRRNCIDPDSHIGEGADGWIRGYSRQAAVDNDRHVESRMRASAASPTLRL